MYSAQIDLPLGIATAYECHLKTNENTSIPIYIMAARIIPSILNNSRGQLNDNRRLLKDGKTCNEGRVYTSIFPPTSSHTTVCIKKTHIFWDQKASHFVWSFLQKVTIHWSLKIRENRFHISLQNSIFSYINRNLTQVYKLDKRTRYSEIGTNKVLFLIWPSFILFLALIDNFSHHT